MSRRGTARVNIAADDSRGADRRREPRHPTCFEATLEFSDGAYESVLLADVSLHGCCVRADSDLLRQGAFVAIALGAEPKVPAIVRWVRGNAAGMEFLRQVSVDRGDWHTLMEPGFAG